jgi:hypothetical protein
LFNNVFEILSSAITEFRVRHPKLAPTIIFDEVTYLIPLPTDSELLVRSKKNIWNKLQVLSTYHGYEPSSPAEFWFASSSAEFCRKLSFRSIF